MNNIKFSHQYEKLQINGCIPSTVMLIEVLSIKLENLSRQFIAYDTDGLYKLPSKGDYLMLIFSKHDGLDIFTTLRRQTDAKEKYYRSKIGEYFNLILEEN